MVISIIVILGIITLVMVAKEMENKFGYRSIKGRLCLSRFVGSMVHRQNMDHPILAPS